MSPSFYSFESLAAVSAKVKMQGWPSFAVKAESLCRDEGTRQWAQTQTSGNTILTVRKTEHWNRFSTVVIGSPPLEKLSGHSPGQPAVGDLA